MDIMMPRVREQAAAAPWLLHRDKINVPRLICELTAQRSDSTPQTIEKELQKREVDAPRELIALWMRDCKIPDRPQS